eukprot:scaffold6342_cov206-Alexandrium_tamarense.AAC.5
MARPPSIPMKIQFRRGHSVQSTTLTICNGALSFDAAHPAFAPEHHHSTTTASQSAPERQRPTPSTCTNPIDVASAASTER